jgi:hypothetical protein
LKRARREVFDVLRIPDWHDHGDLRHSDRYFDGDAYGWSRTAGAPISLPARRRGSCLLPSPGAQRRSSQNAGV